MTLIAVFGDVHGHLAGMYHLVEKYNQRNDRPIDIVLQTGDMGAFTGVDRADSATRKHAVGDPTELGFPDYVAGYSRRSDKVTYDTDRTMSAGHTEPASSRSPSGLEASLALLWAYALVLPRLRP